MNAANGGARVLIGGGGDGTGIQDNDFGFDGSAGALHAAIEQLALDGRAVGLGRAASEVLHMISRHEVIIRGRSERNGKRPLQLREYNLHHSTRCASGLELPWSFP